MIGSNEQETHAHTPYHPWAKGNVTMRLHRFSSSSRDDSDYCTRTSNHFQVSNNAESVLIWFMRFGNGDIRKPNFYVKAEWEDVLAMIDKFCEARHPDALAFREALKLAEAAKELGWCPPETLACALGAEPSNGALEALDECRD